MTRSTIKAYYDADGNYLYFVYGYKHKPDTHESQDNDNKTPQKVLAFILLAFIVAVAMMATTM